MTGLDFTGLTAGPAQVWGGVRLVPLVREEPMPGLRLHREVYGRFGEVLVSPRTSYVSYIPHGLVADWSGEQSAAYGTQLDTVQPVAMAVDRHHRMLKRRPSKKNGKNGKAGQPGGAVTRCRFLPSHLAMEGYLALHFGGPTIAWKQWSDDAVRQGLSPRSEAAFLGLDVPGLADALRVFEIHPGQCGVMVYVADALAAAFVVPHPDDYRALHPTLLQDMYGELIYQYAYFGGSVTDFDARLGDGRHIRTLADLRAAARRREREWRESHDTIMARELLGKSYAFERVYRMASFDMYRFLPPFRIGSDGQHIGELITDHKGRTAYLKTFRLTSAQTRRGYLLNTLADNGWHPRRAADRLGTTPEEIRRRIRAAGFGSRLR
ncbi:ARPP-2 domain-containing protein [Streptomyces sp. NBC_01508]|uniref:ARPP-2 domain-containing protein n=1 Tax=Streptomyces sp. NBC_01508 TaxID=2903888 RepID=UPI0038639ECC